MIIATRTNPIEYSNASCQNLSNDLGEYLYIYIYKENRGGNKE